VQPRQVVQHVRAVVAQIADGVVTIVRVIKSTHRQAREPVKVEHFLEVAYLVRSQVQGAQADEAVKTNANGLDLIACQVEVLQTIKSA